MSLFTSTILGAPRTKKNSSRIVRAGKFTRILPSKAHEVWFKSALPQAQSNAPAKPIETAVNVRATIYRERLTGDAVGYYQAIADLLEHAGIVRNDSQCVSWDGTRLAKDAKNPRIVIHLEAM